MKNLFICFFAFLQISSYSQIEPYELDTQINLTDYYLTQLENCNEEHDIYMELYPGFGVEYVVIESIEDPENRMVVSEKEDFKAEMFGLKSNGKNNLNFKIISLDANNNILEERQIKKSTIKQGQVTVSEGLFAYLHDMGHNNLDGGFGIPNNGGYGNVFTYFCGYNASKVELLAFFQDFLGLSPEQICEFQALFQLAQLNYETSEIITWTNIYCELLNQFWDIYINGFGNGGDEDCQCKVINSSVFIDHSIGAATGEPLEDCPDVGLDEDYQLWAHQGTFPGTNGEDNWWLTRWAKMGAAKSMQTTTHHYEGGFGGDDENKFMKKELYNTDLKSGIQFSMKCFKPHNAEIDPECDCEKEVKIDAQYVSRARGLAGPGLGLGELMLGDVPGRVVGGGVSPKAIGDRLDECGALALERTLSRSTNDFEHGHRIVAIHGHPGDAERLRLGGKTCGGGLATCWCGNCPLVVDAQEDDWHLEHAGDVAGFVEVAFARGTVAKEDERDTGLALQLERPSDAHCVQNLGCKRDLRGKHPYRLGKMPTLWVTERPSREPAQDFGTVSTQCHWFAILRQHPIMGRIQCPRGANGGCFLTIDRSDRADPPLALQTPKSIAGDASLDHLAEHADKVFVVQGWCHPSILVAERLRLGLAAARPGTVAG